ncbi:MAG: hypothetical protein OEM52_12115 [bacterium]|nr:hypothetical protein [bacterium]
MSRISLFVILTITALAFAAERTVHLTIYNNDLAVVREVREVTIASNQLSIADVAERMDPTSVKLSIPGATVIEQNYEYDLVNQQRLLERRLGERIDVVLEKGELVSGKLLTPGSWGIVLETEKEMRLLQSGIQQILIPGNSQGMYLRPTLVWQLAGDTKGKKSAELSYTTNGISWSAEYIGVLAAKGEQLDFNGWVDINNQSGATYPDANLKLIAGDINRVQPERMYRAKGGMAMQTMAMDEAAPQFEERGLFEYHLYELQRPSTVSDRQRKQISLLSAPTVKYEKQLSYQISQGNKKVSVTVKFKNEKASGIEQPLPAGRVRLFQAEVSGNREFVGEDRIDHTGIGNEVKLNVGNAFDVVGETVMEEERRISDRVNEADWKVTLKNSKKEAVTVIASWQSGGEIREPSITPVKKSAHLHEFTVTIPARGESKLTFTVRNKW